MDGVAVSEGYVGGLYALVICDSHSFHHGVYIGTGTMNEWIMNLIGITLIALVVIIWA